MKKTIKTLKFSSIIILVITLFIACDQDYNSIDSDVFGEGNANFNTNLINFPLVSYNKKLDSLQINGLVSNVFGVFNDPAYGQTTASIITQVTPTSFNPSFGENPAIDSVVIRIPYFNKVSADSPDEDGNVVYTIKDSLFGNSPIKLSIYENNYFLRDFNPNAEIDEPQNYYSKADGAINLTDNFAVTEDEVINFDDHKGVMLYENDMFIPSSESIELHSGDEDDPTITFQAPALRIKFDQEEDINYWTSLIISDEVDESVLSNANNFRNYFRGLYFKAEAVSSEGNMVFLNFASSDASIIIHYSRDSTVDDDERTQATYSFNFTGNRLNTFINDFDMVTLENGDKENGDEKLYIKGSSGSMAVVDLFKGMVECPETGTMETSLDCFLKTFRKTDVNGNYIIENGDYVLKKLINEAQLVVYEDEDIATPSNDYHEFDRIYAYDIKNNTPTIDYSFDSSDNSTNPVFSKVINLGRRITDDNDISKYKIRITQHLNNILIRDSTNTKLGLVLSTNVNYINSFKILNSGDDVTEIPAASLITPRGTVIYGSNEENVPENRRMKLELFITDPDN